MLERQLEEASEQLAYPDSRQEARLLNDLIDEILAELKELEGEK